MKSECFGHIGLWRHCGRCHEDRTTCRNYIFVHATTWVHWCSESTHITFSK